MTTTLREPFIIGVAGAARSGKGEVAAAVESRVHSLGLLCRSTGFADLLKVSAARALGYDGADPFDYGDALKVPGTIITVTRQVPMRDGSWAPCGRTITGREFLQHYGTSAHREVFGDDFWVDRALDPRGVDVIVLSDVRFPNEAEAILDRGGVVWAVERPGHEAIPESEHPSEAGLPASLITRYLQNDGSLALLHARAALALVADGAGALAREVRA